MTLKKFFVLPVTITILFYAAICAYAIPADSVYNISGMETGDITTDTQIGDFTIIAASDGLTPVTVDSSSKQSTATGIKYTKRLKLTGTGSRTNRAIKFTASEPATFMIEAASANSSEVRTGVLVNSSGEVVASGDFSSSLSYKKMTVPDAGDYWFYSSSSGINIYYLKLTYEPQPIYNFEDLNGVITEPLDTIYTAPMAPNDGKGTQEEPMSIASAVLNIAPGGTIYCDGTYQFDDCLLIAFGNKGEPGNEKHIECSDGTVFDFSGEPYSGNGSARGVQIDGSYWYIKGLEVYMAADNGFYITGKHNTLELCVANANRDTGIQISRRSSTISDYDEWPSDNLILNCTSFNSYDPATGENADGFAAKLTCGDNNVFDGCIAYNNCDDGWDCFTKSETGPIGTLVMRNCVAFRSGQTTDGNFTDNSDGNGFKMGGSSIAVTHYMYNCIAFENANHGFTDNSNPGPIYLYNCTSFNNALKGGTNKSNFDFARDSVNSNNTLVNCLSFTDTKIASDKFIGSVKNSAMYNNTKGMYYYFEDFPYTNWSSKEGTILPTDTIETVSSSTFVSIDSPPLGADVHKLWRNPDGSINMGSFLKVADGTYYSENNIGADLSGDPIVIPTPEPSLKPQPSGTPEPSETPTPSVNYSLTAAESDRYANKIDIRFDNNTSEQVEPYIMIAVYKTADGTDILTGYTGGNYIISGNASSEFTAALPECEYDKIKVFAWGDALNILPYTNAVEIIPSNK